LRRGFTVVELLVASTVVAIVVAASAGVFTAIHKGARKARVRAELAHVGRVVLSMMARDIQSLWAFEANKDEIIVAVKGEAPVGEDREANVARDELHFVTKSPAEPLGADLVEMSYFVHEDPETGRLALLRRWQAPPDEDITLGGAYETLTDSVISLAFAFYDGNEWLDEWDSVSVMPLAVRVTVGLIDELTGEPLMMSVSTAITGADIDEIEQVLIAEDEGEQRTSE